MEPMVPLQHQNVGPFTPLSPGVQTTKTGGKIPVEAESIKGAEGGKQEGAPPNTPHIGEGAKAMLSLAVSSSTKVEAKSAKADLAPLAKGAVAALFITSNTKVDLHEQLENLGIDIGTRQALADAYVDYNKFGAELSNDELALVEKSFGNLGEGKLKDILNQPDSKGRTPVHIGIRNQDIYLVELLIKGGADLNAPDKRGNTPLHVAAKATSTKAMKMLMQEKPQLEVRNKLGHTPLDVAQITKSKGSETVLINAGAKNRDLPALCDSYSCRKIFSLEPKIPKEGINDPKLNDNALNNFIGSHDAKAQSAIKSMIDNTDYVSFSAFEKQFDKVIDHLNNTIPAGEDYIILVEPKKSNIWLAELALAKLDNPPKDIVRMEKVEKILKKPENANVKHIMLLDDASYSGQQICEFTREKAVRSLTNTNHDDFTVHLAIPYVTEWAEQKIHALNQDPNVLGKGKVVLSPHEKMKAANDQVPKEHHEILTRTAIASYYTQNIQMAFGFCDANPNTYNNIIDILDGRRFTKVQTLNSIVNTAEDVFSAPDIGGLSDVAKLYRLADRPGILESAKSIVPALIEFYEKNEVSIKQKIKDYHDGIPGTSDDEADGLTAFVEIMENMLIDIEEVYGFDKGLASRTLTVFDHKVADGLSTWPGYQGGEVYKNGEITVLNKVFPGKPPYK